MIVGREVKAEWSSWSGPRPFTGMAGKACEVETRGLHDLPSPTMRGGLANGAAAPWVNA